MSNTPIDNGSRGNKPRLAGRWFTFLVFILFAWTGLYIYTHQNRIFDGYQMRKLSRDHIEDLNRILYEAATPVMPAPQIKDTVKPNPADTSAKPDSTTTTVPATKPVTQQLVMDRVCDDSCKIDKALLYVRTEFDNKIRKEEESVIADYIRTYKGTEVTALLEGHELKVNSYFWLSGPYMYLEMIFWVIFGVICSNLFAMSTRRFSSFNSKEIPYQVAKFFYAPVFAVILILAYHYFKHNEVSDVNATEGTIVFSFIVGLFSSGLMSFLDRFKDALFPENVRERVAEVTEEVPAPVVKKVKVKPVSEDVVVKPKQEPQEVKEVKIEPAPVVEETPTVINDLYKEQEAPKSHEEELEAISSSMAFIAEEQPTSEPEVVTPSPETSLEVIPQVVVMLNLDISGLYEEEKNEIIDIGFANAVLTMHNVNGREIITARKSDDKYTASFVAPDVKPGIYIVRCTLTQKLSDDYTINLFGEKTVYITHENTMLELFIKKYEAID